MIEQLAQSVASLMERLHKTERETESTYLSLGELFPRLVAETDASARKAQDSLDAVLGALGGGEGADVEDFLSQASRFFEELRGNDKAFLVSVHSGIGRISELDEIITKVRSDSEEMEIVSLNALTAALKSGSAGRAFSVITDELKQLSARTIATTVNISSQGQRLLESFRLLGEDLTELSSLQERFFEEMRSTLTTGFSELEDRVQKAADAFRELVRESSGVRKPITGIMQGVQVQDILRQSIDHVILSLEEIAKDDEVSPKDELAFVAAVAELSISVLDDVIQRMDEGTALTSGLISEVVSVVENVDRRRQTVSDGYEDISANSGTALERAETYLKLKNQALGMGRDLSEQVKKLNDSFKILYSLLGRFQNIVVASRIEIARTRALAVVSNTVAGMIEITENLGEDVGKATEVTKTFIKTASADILAYGRNQEQSDQRLGSAVRRLESELERLETARIRVKETIVSFRLYTPEFLELIQTSRSSLDRMSALSRDLGTLRDEIGILRSRAAEEAGRLEGGDSDLPSIRNERLRRMVERFTIFTHKKTAGSLGNFKVEEGVGSGEVTLF